MTSKKRYSPEEKTIILREHLENNVPVSDLAERYNVNPTVIYNWRKNLFESAPESLSRSKKKENRTESRAEKELAELKALLARRDALITELVQENMDLKKKSNGEALIRNGSNRK